MIPRTRLLWLLSAGLIFGTLQPEVNAIELADKTFGVITNKDPFIINFYAPWCEGCIKFGPEWARLVQRFGSFEQNTTRFGEINIQNEKGLAKVFHSPHVPSIVRYHDGSIWRYEGLMTYDSLSRFFFDEPKSWSARAPDLKFPRTSEILGPLSPAQKRALLDETEKPPLIDPEQVELVRRTLPVKLNLKQLIKTTAEGRWIVNMCTPYVASCLHAIPKWVDAMNTMRSGSNTNDIQFGEIVFESTILKQYRLLPAGPVLLM